MKLRTPIHGKNDANRYCGPAVISCLTGMTTGEAARLIRARTGKTNVMGTYTHEVRGALSQCGLQMTPIALSANGLTLTQWLAESVAKRKAGIIYLVLAGNHWQLISGRRYVCGRIGEIVSIKDKRVKRRARVSAVWRIDFLPGRTKVTIPEIARKPKKTSDPHLTQLKALECRFGFKGKIERDGDWKDYIVPPCETFPNGFETVHYDWAETLRRVEICLEDPELIDEGRYSE